jgi:aminopeptidase N
VRQFSEAENMTNELAALDALVAIDCPERQAAIDAFEAKWSSDQLVMRSWFSVQALCPLDGTLSRVRALMEHPAWDRSNGNMVSALVAAFANNPQFHDASGGGYAFLTDFILDADMAGKGSQAAGLTRVFTPWTRYDGHRQKLIKAQLLRIRGTRGISANVFEVADKILASGLATELAVEEEEVEVELER